MSLENNIWKLAEGYLTQTLSAEETKSLEQRLASDKTFANEFQEASNMLRSLNKNGEQKRFQQTLGSINQKIKTEAENAPRKISLRTHYMRTAAVAAGVALIATLGTNLWHNRSQGQTSKYAELRKVRTEIEGIKQSQNRIIKDLNTKANKPAIENKYSGTGFALSNDGYIVTNYHVTEGADSLYIQTRDGSYYKASTVSFDANADIAILKVESKKFRFSKQGVVPYSFATGKSGLGERIFTLGYPQDEVVYSEGYISSKNGYMGDSMQYRLELPAEPGQSGAPVIDASGAVVGIVTGKESKSISTTYAVSSKTMLRLLRNIPQASSITLPKSSKLGKMSRSQQIEKIQDFTCVVNVYK
ncbi:MAG: serine protease [Chitinophagaceae bacterium]|jgi:S1-C subfamily serine protease